MLREIDTRQLWLSLALAVVLGGVACPGDDPSGTTTEGTNAGECSDAADNDGDGLFDCDDDDCAASPDCAREGDDAGECSDGADNDEDGLFDCEDDDCAASPDCPAEGDQPGECSDGVDNDGDGLFDCNDDDCATSPYCLCDDGCTELDARDCSGSVARQCTWGPGGCLRWVEVEDCNSTALSCLRGACVVSRCSVSGGGCETDGDCGGVNVSVTGHCITLDAGGGDWACGYDASVNSGDTVTCEGTTFLQCEVDADCPDGTDGCQNVPGDWCGGTAADGICSIALLGTPSCADDSECTYLAHDVCVICGDGVVDAPFEECEYEPLCSSTCRMGGTCYSEMAGFFGRCLSDADCNTAGNPACMLNCTCVPAPP